MAASGRAYAAFALAEPGVFSVMFRPEMIDLDDRAHGDEAARSFTQLVDLVAAAQTAGWHRDEDAGDLATVLWSHVHGLATFAVHGALATANDTVTVDRLSALSSALVFGPRSRPPDLVRIEGAAVLVADAGHQLIGSLGRRRRDGVEVRADRVQRATEGLRVGERSVSAPARQ